MSKNDRIQRTFSRGMLVFLLLLGAGPVAKNSIWTDVQRIVAVGDVHGDYAQLVRTLRAAKVIDKENRWIGGKTHLVQTGDVLDRGADSRKVMDLLMDLEVQAPEAGGRVHALIGNHESMILFRDLRYVHPGEYASFGGKDAYLDALSPEGKYGKWIASHNAVIQINDTLFLHGGISADYASMPLKKINEMIREDLKKKGHHKGSFATDIDGPLWYRGLARKDEDEIATILETVFETHGVRRIVTGHTVSKGGIQRRAEGRVVMIDVGMSRHYGGPAGCLLIEDGKAYAVYPESTEELVTARE